MAITISFTYQTRTPDSVEHGDIADHGFYAAGGWCFLLSFLEVAADIEANPHLYCCPWQPGDLRAAIATARSLGIYEPSDSSVGKGTWFASVDPDVDFETGAETFYAMHVEGVNVATSTASVSLERPSQRPE